jgi:molybdate transport system regulatory protein
MPVGRLRGAVMQNAVAPYETRMPRRRIEPAPNFRLQIKRGVVLGPGKVALLEHIAELGSISQAGKAMQMSYRTAWELVTAMNEHFVEPLVASTKGGAGGGGASLTPLGKDVLRCYRAMERRALKAISKDIAHLDSLIRD